MKREYKVSEPYNLTNEEAINAIEKNMPLTGTYTVLTESLHMAIKALRRQEPMKVTSVGEHYPHSNCDTMVDYDCPNCGEIISFEYMSQDSPDCCPWCGQSLDWRK